MKITQQAVELRYIFPDDLRYLSERARVSYQSEPKDMLCGAQVAFLRQRWREGHETCFELPACADFRVITNRGVTHELVRHRLASFVQTSTRYVGAGRHGMEVIPCVHVTDDVQKVFDFLEAEYTKLIEAGEQKQAARDILPNALKAEIWMAANYREWYHVLRLRRSHKAHPQIRWVADQIANLFGVHSLLWKEVLLPELNRELKDEIKEPTYEFDEPHETGGNCRVRVTVQQIVAWFDKVHPEHVGAPTARKIEDFCTIHYAERVFR